MKYLGRVTFPSDVIKDGFFVFQVIDIVLSTEPFDGKVISLITADKLPKSSASFSVVNSGRIRSEFSRYAASNFAIESATEM